MNIETQLVIDAPCKVVFRFFCALDHLRCIEVRGQRVWCTKAGLVVTPKLEGEVRVQRGRHQTTARFRNLRFQQDNLMEDEFLTWPIRGARYQQVFASIEAFKTSMHILASWDPPWYLRKWVERHEPEQRTVFCERQMCAKRLIEAVYAERGEDAFRTDIQADVAQVRGVSCLDAQ